MVNLLRSASFSPIQSPTKLPLSNRYMILNGFLRPPVISSFGCSVCLVSFLHFSEQGQGDGFVDISDG